MKGLPHFWLSIHLDFFFFFKTLGWLRLCEASHGIFLGFVPTEAKSKSLGIMNGFKWVLGFSCE